MVSGLSLNFLRAPPLAASTTRHAAVGSHGNQGPAHAEMGPPRVAGTRRPWPNGDPPSPGGLWRDRPAFAKHYG